MKRLSRILDDLVGETRALFTLADLRAALPDLGESAFRSLIFRTERDGLLRRVCHGLYLYPRARIPDGLILYHAAARLMADAFNYISLESALSDAGVISQIPMNHVTLMTSGRSATFDCGDFGSIEFVHTKKSPADLADDLSYDQRCRLWRASSALALRDMKAARRNLDLIDWEAVHEPV